MLGYHHTPQDLTHHPLHQTALEQTHHTPLRTGTPLPHDQTNHPPWTMQPPMTMYPPGTMQPPGPCIPRDHATPPDHAAPPGPGIYGQCMAGMHHNGIQLVI